MVHSSFQSTVEWVEILNENPNNFLVFNIRWTFEFIKHIFSIDDRRIAFRSVYDLFRVNENISVISITRRSI